MREMICSKIHLATVTEANVNYVGSITIDKDLIEKSGLWAGQKVLVVSVTSGARLETYVIEGVSNSGVICMNGAAAHLIKKGEIKRSCSSWIRWGRIIQLQRKRQRPRGQSKPYQPLLCITCRETRNYKHIRL
ncbi:aspartate 1-decarboxylase [Candidatus Pacearchaeota archaeon]|nr:aspartate 1-decarboxylase [Candidatus Pacearchaeota archaeon]